MDRKLEICCGDIQSVRAALEGGADRVELCSGLEAGGLTPSIGLIKAAVEIAKSTKMLVHVLIRPREGDFLYTEDETEVMISDIDSAREAGADGVVIGALNQDGDIDVETCRRMVEHAHGLNITFHRAFDLCRDAEKALENIIELGCNRILTSGQAPTAEKGIGTLQHLNKIADGRLTILAGSGVTPANARKIIDEAEVCELHASARSTCKSKMVYRNEGVSMGAPDSDEYTRKATDQSIVKQLSEIINEPITQ